MACIVNCWPVAHDVQAVAPSRIPKAFGEQIKTSRSDGIKLARLARSGDDLTQGDCILE